MAFINENPFPRDGNATTPYIHNRPDLPGPPNNPPTMDVTPAPTVIPGNPEWTPPEDSHIATGTPPGA